MDLKPAWQGTGLPAGFLPAGGRCPRMTGSSVELKGYAAGIEKKRWLLQHERAGLQNAGCREVSY